VELPRLEELPPGPEGAPRPTRGVHHLRPAHVLVSRIAVALEDTFERAQELLGPVASAPQAEVEHHAASRSAVLPQIGLMVLPPPIVHLHVHRRFIGLDVTAAN